MLCKSQARIQEFFEENYKRRGTDTWSLRGEAVSQEKRSQREKMMQGERLKWPKGEKMKKKRKRVGRHKVRGGLIFSVSHPYSENTVSSHKGSSVKAT